VTHLDLVGVIRAGAGVGIFAVERGGRAFGAVEDGAGLGLVDPTPSRVGLAVGNAIMSIITLDAVLVLARCGERWAVAVLCLLVWFLLWKRLVPPT
jgi:hypothetical protein